MNVKIDNLKNEPRLIIQKCHVSKSKNVFNDVNSSKADLEFETKYKHCR